MAYSKDIEAPNDKQIIKEFLKLVQRHDTLTVSPVDPIRRSSPQVKDFLHRYVSGFKLIRILEDPKNQDHFMEHPSIIFKHENGNMIFIYDESKQKIEFKIIHWLIALVNSKKVMNIDLYLPAQNPNLKSFLSEHDYIDSTYFSFILEKHKDLLRNNLTLIEDEEFEERWTLKAKVS